LTFGNWDKPLAHANTGAISKSFYSGFWHTIHRCLAGLPQQTSVRQAASIGLVQSVIDAKLVALVGKIVRRLDNGDLEH
jgi:hypothetical protein